jgi:hypothetical protein
MPGRKPTGSTLGLGWLPISPVMGLNDAVADVAGTKAKVAAAPFSQAELIAITTSSGFNPGQTPTEGNRTFSLALIKSWPILGLTVIVINNSKSWLKHKIPKSRRRSSR